MKKLLEIIKDLFEDFDENDFSEDLELSQIPDWDSMNAINFQMEIEAAFGVELNPDFIDAFLKVSDVIKELKRLGVNINPEK
jgi:acyl carrier protein